MSRLKISMACWLIASESATLEKIAAARRLGVPLGFGPTASPRTSNSRSSTWTT
jgi:hypothetical protein